VLEPGEPATFAPEVQVLAGEYALGQAAGSLTRSLLADSGDVYWYDYAGTVFVARQGSGPVIELSRAEPPSERDSTEEIAFGLAANGDHVFVGYGQRARFSDMLEYDPPGRLLSLSKRDGQVEVLLDLDAYWIAPILADSERVIVFAEGGYGSLDTGFYQVPLAAPRLEPLPLGFLEGQLVGDHVYWLNRGYSPLRLLRGGFNDTEPELVLQASDNYSVGSGYILTQEDVWLPGYYYVGKDLVVRDESGCRSVRGARRLAAAELTLDGQFAYWLGYSDAPIGSSSGDIRVTRVDLKSGALTYLSTPALTASTSLQIVGQDDTRLFLRTADALVSLQKP
jgi:hypothetical protein